MSSHVYAIEHIIKDPVPLKSRALSSSGRFSPSFVRQVIIITGLNKLYDCTYVLALKMALDADRTSNLLYTGFQIKSKSSLRW